MLAVPSKSRGRGRLSRLRPDLHECDVPAPTQRDHIDRTTHAIAVREQQSRRSVVVVL